MKKVHFLIVVFLSLIALVSFAQTRGNKQVMNGVLLDPVILFQEDFDDTDFASRGWYDHLSGTITTAEHIEGSTACFECKFLLGTSGCEGGVPGRHLFNATEEIYISYYVKYSENYTGSDKPYHPHEFYFLTTENSIWVGPAWTHLTAYIEHNEGEPLLSIQDGENIDISNIGVDLVGVSENRAVAGCNGDSDGYGDGDCYISASGYSNGKQWRSGSVYFQDDEGAYYKNDWHFIEAYFKLNSIVDGIGIADGRVKYWFDNEILIDHEDIVFRTGAFPDMKFNQFLMAPYIGPGSPVEQYMWVDNLTVATSRDSTTRVDDFSENIIGLLNYPNPFRQITSIQYVLSERTFVELAIYNANAKKIDCLLSEEQAAGSHRFEWNAASLAAGIYYCKLLTSDGVQIRKLIVLNR